MSSMNKNKRLLLSAKPGDVQQFRKLIHQGADVNSVDSKGTKGRCDCNASAIIKSLKEENKQLNMTIHQQQQKIQQLSAELAKQTVCTAASVHKVRATAASVQKECTTAASVQKEGTTAASVQKEGTTAASVHKESATAASVQKESATAASVQKESATAASVRTTQVLTESNPEKPLIYSFIDSTRISDLTQKAGGDRKLTLKLLRELFSTDCLKCHTAVGDRNWPGLDWTGLDKDKYNAIIDYVRSVYPDAKVSELNMAINLACRDARNAKRKTTGTADTEQIELLQQCKKRKKIAQHGFPENLETKL